MTANAHSPQPIHNPVAPSARPSAPWRRDARDRSKKACGGARVLLGIPVYNEERYVSKVLEEVRRYAGDILVIDDGSTDETPTLLARQPVEVIRHAENRGYGRSMQDMLRWAKVDGFDWLITMDCDEQHEPASIPRFMDEIRIDNADVISGSRYHAASPSADAPPSDRRAINQAITAELNERLGLSLTDAFCGFKAYRVSACSKLSLDVDGYDFPMQFWVQARAQQLRIREIPVRLIYNDPSRSFGGPLDDPARRKAVYIRTMHQELRRFRALLPTTALSGIAGPARQPDSASEADRVTTMHPSVSQTCACSGGRDSECTVT